MFSTTIRPLVLSTFCSYSTILILISSTGIIVSGCPGTGKTALILQLVEYSCFGRKRNCEYEELREQSDIREMLPEELTIGMFTHLASHVVAYHFCQVCFEIKVYLISSQLSILLCTLFANTYFIFRLITTVPASWVNSSIL